METIPRKDKRRELPAGWELTRIGYIADTHGGSTPSTAEPEYWDDGGILWATPTDITSLNTKYISDTKRKISQKATGETSLRLLEAGTLLMTSRATIGYLAIAEKPITTNQGFINIHCGNKVETLFLYYWIAQNRALLERFAQGSTFLELSKKDFRRFHIDLPPLPEQRKITEILSTVDETIEKTDAIIQETQQLKKGLMQKLFTEGIGHTRFKETKIGRIPEEWECWQARDVANRVTDGSHLSPKPFNSSPYLIATVKDVGDYGLNLETCVGISESDYNQLVRNGCKPFTGDVLLTKDGSVGKTLVWDYDREIVILSSIAIFSPKVEIIDSVFMKYFLDSNTNQSWLERLTGGTALQRVILKDLRKLSIVVPPLPEQRKITQILSQVDSKIQTEQASKEELEKLKKGLMQVLLTGKVRVKV